MELSVIYWRGHYMMRRKYLLVLIVMMALFTGCGKQASTAQTESSVSEDMLADSSESDDSFWEDESFLEPDSTGAIQTFDISDSQNFIIYWDMDVDGTAERVEFDFDDQGDEAPSCIVVTLFTQDERMHGYIDSCYGIDTIFEKEDEDGRYLDIYYSSGDYYFHDNQSQCTLRVEDGEIVLEGDDLYYY